MDLPEPEAAAEVVVRVHVAGVNPVDWKTIERLTEDDRFPKVLGQDFAGVATHVEGSPAIARHTHVFGIARTFGGFAEMTRIGPAPQAEPIARIPDGVSFEQAAALPTAGLTALAAVDVLEAAPHRVMAIVGASGAVGSYATQIAAARGARVIAVVRDDGTIARENGAADVIDARAGDVVAALRASHPQGVDTILDVVSDASGIVHVAEALKRGGRIGSTIRAIDERTMRDAGYDGRNVNLVEMPHASADGLTRLAEMVVAGIVRVRITERHALADVPDVLARGKAGSLQGKAVVTIRE